MIVGFFKGLSAYRKGLAAVLAVYAVAYGWLLLAGNLLPYVFDNNETFSSLVHARNLLNFGLGGSFGLTDEAYGDNPAAHPYVYTHQGNLPRFFALLLYVLGARTAESQIVIATFTIGVAGVFFAYHYFARQANPAFAAVFCLLLMTDYVMVAQWQVNTWRVWHLFFFFSSLLCVEGIGGPRPRLWLALTALNFFALFYYEFIFAAFVAIMSGLYAGYAHRRRLGRILLAWSAEGAGALLAVVLLIAQVVGHFGWEKFLLDLDFTFTARNLTTADPAPIESARRFFESNRIVFWDNFYDTSGLRWPGKIAERFSTYNLTLYTPTLVLLALLLFGGWLVGLLPARGQGDGAGALARLRGLAATTVAGPLAWQLAVAGFLLFAFAVVTDTSFAGISAESAARSGAGFAELGYLGIAVLALAGLLGAEVAALGREGVPLARLIGAVGLLGLAAVHALSAPMGEARFFEPLLRDVASALGPMAVARTGILIAGALALLVALGIDRPGPAARLTGLLPYLGVGTAAFLTVFVLSPGYVMTGYFHRHAPFTVFVHMVPFAVAFYMLLGLARWAWRRMTLAPWFALRLWRRDPLSRVRLRQPWPGIAWSIGRVAATGGALVFALAYWGVLQGTYVARVPPDHFAFLDLLKEPPYRGASFVVNTYAAPIAATTGQWAYNDPAIARGTIALADEGFVVARDWRYLWLADRGVNSAYRQPDYFLCISVANFYSLVHRGEGPAVQPGSRCSKVALVRQARDRTQAILNHQLIAADDSGLDRWAIVRLDWDYPPYLRPLADGKPGPRVRVAPKVESMGIGFDVEFTYAQQQGKPKAGAIYTLYRIEGRCGDRPARTQLARVERPAELRLPAGFVSQIQIGVAPRSATKVGPEFLSDVLELGNARPKAESCRDRWTQQWKARKR